MNKAHNRIAILGKIAVGLALVFPLLTAFSAVTFTETQIVDNKILWAYNAVDNKTYINGADAGVNFANAATADSAISLSASGSPRWLQVARTSATAGTSYSFTWDFLIPDGYEIADISVLYRLTAPAGVADNKMTLSWSKDGGAYTEFDSLTTSTAIDDTGSRTIDLSTSLNGAQKISIMGTYLFTNDASAAGGALRFFQADGSGVETSRFGLTVSLHPTNVPEPSTVALLLGICTLTLAIWRIRSRR